MRYFTSSRVTPSLTTERKSPDERLLRSSSMRRVQTYTTLGELSTVERILVNTASLMTPENGLLKNVKSGPSGISN